MNTPEPNLLTFPIKLKCIVDSPETDHLIYWDEGGLSFHITDENQLARDVIPNYFKHNNISSFIRQLNMYGFHKVNRIENGLSFIGNEIYDSQWSHPYFVRDKPDMLQNITRKVTNSQLLNSLIDKNSNSNDVNLVENVFVKNDISQLVKAVQYLEQRDKETSEKLKTLQDENQRLYSVLMYLQKEHNKQSELIDILVKFFSLCANNPSDTRLKSKRVFAIEMPNSKSSSIKNSNEPPKKYFVTSSNSCPQVSVSNEDKNSFKGKKLIKITPTSILSDNRICGLPIINNGQQNSKPSQLLSISLPKTKNNIIIPARSITASANTNNKPTIVIHQPKFNPSNIIINNVPKKPVSKSVTVSSIDSDFGNEYNSKCFNDISVKSVQLSSSNRNNPLENSNESNYFNILQMNEAECSSGSNLSHNVSDSALFNVEFKNQPDISHMISDITSNVSSVGESLKQTTKSLSMDTDYLSDVVNHSNIPDFRFHVDHIPSRYYDGNDPNTFTNTENHKIFLEEMKKENFSGDLSKIQEQELISSNSYQNDWPEPVYNYQDNFSVDDLLQTPEICSEESSLSFNDLKYSLFPSNNLFNEKSSP